MARPVLVLTCLVASYLHLIHAVVPIISATTSTTTDIDMALKAGCQKAMATCQPGDPCYLPHPETCNKYVVCTQTDIASQFRPLVMPCAFGTVWKSGPLTGSLTGAGCYNAELVDCATDPCRVKGTTSYAHADNNCRTFWSCKKGRSKPQCCRKYMRFDPALGQCVMDPTCSDLCPLINDATCSGAGVRAIDMPDGNCKTYYECKVGLPHPVCCQDGFSYDVIMSSCVEDANCVDVCPGYSNLCITGDVPSYELQDFNCRTYMKCYGNGKEARSCCASGYAYNGSQMACVPTESIACKQKRCPNGFKEPCRLEAVADPTKFKNMDAFGGTIMPCPVGTVFDNVQCNCRADPVLLERLKSQRPGCRAAINVKLPSLENHGAVFAAIMRLGNLGQGESGVGNMTVFWDGNDGINIPHFGEQSLTNIYIQITFKPAAASGPTKQIMLSSCSYLGGASDSPTLEVALQPAGATSGGLRTRLQSSLANNFELILPYTVDTWYTYSLIYDGSKVGVILQAAAQGTQPLSTAADVNVGNFTGSMKIYRSGLRFSKCRYEQDVSGFIGNVGEITVAKCLTPEIKSILEPAATAVVPPPS